MDAARFASVSCPVVLNDDVAVPPKYAGPYAEKREVEAFWNVCNPVQLFAFARFSDSDVEPPSAIEPPPERPEPADMVSAEFWS